ncbi:DUF6221 family protein [Streptosporangium sp. NPDC049078]|uniref:DUF6221 family protein n=1 Tax=Streptosporangium sp. NPDC049078 TaxID=3155767 RepID=UPI00341D7F2E
MDDLKAFLSARWDKEHRDADADVNFSSLSGVQDYAARTLRDIETKQRILASWPDPFGRWTAEQADAARAMKEQILRQFAKDYDQHPDYAKMTAASESTK